jgi:hypothetical protein
MISKAIEQRAGARLGAESADANQPRATPWGLRFHLQRRPARAQEISPSFVISQRQLLAGLYPAASAA